MGPPPPLHQQLPQQEEDEEGEVGGVVEMMPLYSRPSGFRFNPTDLELVLHFLSNKINGRRTGLTFDPSTIIPTVEIYGPSSSEPWRLCQQLSFPYASTKNPSEFFCFTTRNQLHTQGDRCHRTSGFGTWFSHGKGKDKEIWDDDGGILVGRISFFSFKVPPLGVTGHPIHKNQMVTTHWVMHEYRLESSQFQKTVLCRIRNQKKDNDMAKGRWTIPWWEEETFPTPSRPPPPPASINPPDEEIPTPSPPPPASINPPDDDDDEEDNRRRTGETSSSFLEDDTPVDWDQLVELVDWDQFIQETKQVTEQLEQPEPVESFY